MNVLKLTIFTATKFFYSNKINRIFHTIANNNKFMVFLFLEIISMSRKLVWEIILTICLTLLVHKIIGDIIFVASIYYLLVNIVVILVFLSIYVLLFYAFITYNTVVFDKTQTSTTTQSTQIDNNKIVIRRQLYSQLSW